FGPGKSEVIMSPKIFNIPLWGGEFIYEVSADLSQYSPGQYFMDVYAYRKRWKDDNDNGVHNVDLGVETFRFARYDLIIGGGCVLLPEINIKPYNDLNLYPNDDPQKIYESSTRVEFCPIAGNGTNKLDVFVNDDKTIIRPSQIKYDWRLIRLSDNVEINNSTGTADFRTMIQEGVCVDISSQFNLLDVNKITKTGQYKICLDMEYELPAEIAIATDTITVEQLFTVYDHGVQSTGFVEPILSIQPGVEYNNEPDFPDVYPEDRIVPNDDLEVGAGIKFTYKSNIPEVTGVDFYEGVHPDSVSYRLTWGNQQTTDYIPFSPDLSAYSPDTLDIYDFVIPQAKLLKFLDPGKEKVTLEIRYKKSKWEKIPNVSPVVFKEKIIENGAKIYFTAKKEITINVIDLTPPEIEYLPVVIKDKTGKDVMPGSGDEVVVKVKITDNNPDADYLDPDSLYLYVEKDPVANNKVLTQETDPASLCKKHKLVPAGNNLYSATIKIPVNFASKIGKKLDYYVEAKDKHENFNNGDIDIKASLNVEPYGKDGRDSGEIIVYDNDPPEIYFLLRDNMDQLVYPFKISGGEENDDIANNVYSNIRIVGKVSKNMTAEFEMLDPVIVNPIVDFDSFAPTMTCPEIDMGLINSMKFIQPKMVEKNRAIIELEAVDAVDGDDVKLYCKGMNIKKGKNYFIVGKQGSRYELLISATDGRPNPDNSVSVRVIKLVMEVVPYHMSVQTLYKR
ncbi:hypothetical protein KAJ27_01315, partial [bacterium]|nr:hypothetical protein [bacterium]